MAEPLSRERAPTKGEEPTDPRAIADYRTGTSLSPLITNTDLVGSAERDSSVRRRAELNKELTKAFTYTTDSQPFAIGQQGLFCLIAGI